MSDAMPSVIFVTQKIDRSDPVLGFTARWAHALGTRCSRLVVIANEVHDPVDDLGLEVWSLGKERGFRRARRAARYLRFLERLGRQQRWSGLLAHMCPQYLNLAAPIALPRRIPLYLWFAHPSRTLSLRFSERVAHGLLTSLPDSYPGQHPRLHVIGQGTVVASAPFEPPRPPASPLRLLTLGRTARPKGLPPIVEALALARERGVAVTLEIVGPSTTEAEHTHRRELVEMVRRLDIGDCVLIRDGVPPDVASDVLLDSHVLVNNTVPGSGDKAVFEAMAAGRMVLVSNPSFVELLAGIDPPAMYPPDDAASLAASIEAIAGSGLKRLGTAGAELRRRVQAHHSLDHWADSVAAILASATPGVRRSAHASG